MHLGTRIRATALASAGLFVVVACGGNNNTPSLNLAPAAQQILRVNTGVEPNSFDPTQQTFTYEAAVGRNTLPATVPHLFRCVGNGNDHARTNIFGKTIRGTPGGPRRVGFCPTRLLGAVAWRRALTCAMLG